MKIIGLLSWFDERPSDLRRAVESHAPYIDHLVAVDGRYASFADRRTASPGDQSEAIMAACWNTYLGLTVSCLPREPWAGEVSKRRYMMRLGRAEATAHVDWLWVIDADNELTDAPTREALRTRLMTTDLHAAEVVLSEPGNKWPDVRRPMRQLFRALPGLSVTGRHCDYVGLIDGRWEYVWGPQERQMDALSLDDVVVRHHTKDRVPYRRGKAVAYYAYRDERAIERPATWLYTGEDGEIALGNAEDELEGRL